ncbi:cytoplasmic dynein 2 light intermediate chain 1-like [Aricia agestis]|uniref:cytoplasmic dynein 2 light intermediate chain 1-like n=1 Tax=Aricia agestis TaxID=91739 RepID=UPI001C202F0B|nr:cytoplasmic dynein 2 light intermediate chain 1-like [Aricia agestis]
MSILDIATEIYENNISESSKKSSYSVCLVGSKSVGKSTLIHHFLDKHDAVKETLVLEYSYGRKTSPKQGMEKTICHVWEYGGRMDMLSTVLKAIPTGDNFTYCIMIDLSKIKTLWNVMETSIRSMIDNFDAKLPELVIICGKYDLFKNYDSEVKKVVCTTMRSVALLYNAPLMFFSSKEPQLLKKGKDLLYSTGFGTSIPQKEKIVNYSKPLSISKGVDTWEQIGYPPSTLEQIKRRFISSIECQNEVKPEIKSLQRTHPEPILDSLAALKYDELRRIETFEPAIEEYLEFMNK